MVKLYYLCIEIIQPSFAEFNSHAGFLFHLPVYSLFTIKPFYMMEVKQPKKKLALNAIQADAEQRLAAMHKPDENDLLIDKTATDWIEEAKTKPVPLMLFSELWYEGETCFLYADTNVGKSILAVTIADSISKGTPLQGFKLEAPAQKVVYVDFEINCKQFERRSSDNFEGHYSFSENFIRVELNSRNMSATYTRLEDYIIAEMERVMLKHQAKILIVDNLTFLSSDAEKSKEASELMKSLNRLADLHGWSILVLSHTPKRDPSQQLLMKDLKGSGSLAIFCDSAFAIGRSARDKDLRYIKQVKQRSTHEIYGEENVIICLLTKHDNFMQFIYQGLGNERAHLRRKTEEEVTSQQEQAIELYNSGLSLRKIADKVGKSHAWVKIIVDKHKAKKQA